MAHAMFRPRRLREKALLRAMTRETSLAVDDFVYPLFVVHGRGVREPITSMPGQSHLSVDELVRLAFTASHLRLGHVRNVVLPGGTGSIGGLSVVTLSMATARAIFRDAKEDGALRPGNVPRSPTGVR